MNVTPAGNWIVCTNLMRKAFPRGDDRPYFGGPFMWFTAGQPVLSFHAIPALEHATGVPHWLLRLAMVGAFFAWMMAVTFREFDAAEKRQTAE